VLFLFIAAALYIVFASRADEGIIWVVGEVVGVVIFGGVWLCSASARIAMVDRRGMGFASPVGRRALLPRARKIVRSPNLHHRMPQFRSAGRSLHRHQLRSRRTTQESQKKGCLTSGITRQAG
jgi:hypothetical protein